MSAPRSLVVTADDFGIGVETSRGILELSHRGVVTSTVLLVNSPFAEASVDLWRRAGRPVELGWHPCLTLDAPISPAYQVPSLVDRRGRFHSLPSFLLRLATGRIDADELTLEFAAQYRRFVEIVGAPPALVNAHHHLHIFPLVGATLRNVLRDASARPYMRRVVGSSSRGNGVWKQRFLFAFGRRAALAQIQASHAGADALLGIASARATEDPRFFTSLLASCKERVVELACHPGFADASLRGRDDSLPRAPEMKRLADPSFRIAAADAGFHFLPASRVSEGEYHRQAA